MSATDSPEAVVLPFLQLSAYDRELCRKLAGSSETDSGVQRMARLLLDLGSCHEIESLTACTGLTGEQFVEIRRGYVEGGLSRPLNSGPRPAASYGNTCVCLTTADRNYCQSVVESQEGSSGRIRRAQAMLLLDQGKSKKSSALATNAHVRTVNRLVKRYNDGGIELAVNDGERTGRPVRYSKTEFVPLIQQIVTQELAGLSRRFNSSKLRQALARHRPDAARMSMPTLRALAAAAGFSSQRPPSEVEPPPRDV